MLWNADTDIHIRVLCHKIYEHCNVCYISIYTTVTGFLFLDSDWVSTQMYNLYEQKYIIINKYMIFDMCTNIKEMFYKLFFHLQ